jgi:chemotaxis protein CheD
MLHFQLPDSKLDTDKALAKPFMFADTGLKLLMQTMISAGCHKGFMEVKIAGGASMRNGPSNFDIGKRNHLAIRKCLWRAGLMIKAEEVGGDFPRSLFMEVETGKIMMKTPSQTKGL